MHKIFLLMRIRRKSTYILLQKSLYSEKYFLSSVPYTTSILPLIPTPLISFIFPPVLPLPPCLHSWIIVFGVWKREWWLIHSVQPPCLLFHNSLIWQGRLYSIGAHDLWMFFFIHIVGSVSPAPPYQSTGRGFLGTPYLEIFRYR